MPSGLGDAKPAESVRLPAPLMLTTGVERVFLDRARRPTAAALTPMLVAGADDTGDLDHPTRRHPRGLPGRRGEAERSGVLIIGGDMVAVGRPLARSAAFQAATAAERRGVHRALADALGSLEDSDRATWRRAAVADATRDPAVQVVPTRTVVAPASTQATGRGAGRG